MDLSGLRFGRWTVLKCDPNKKRYHICQCDCGNIKSVFETNLKAGKTKSCGCLSSEVTTKRNTKHNLTNTKAYRVWSNMRRRCYDTRNSRYERYGGRGIKVCDEWRTDFISFYYWLQSQGYDESLGYGKQTIDRIDNDGNYEPSNCRLATIQEQNRNRGTRHVLEYDGKKMSITEWNEYLGFTYGTIDRRIRNGWSVEKAITTPLRRIKHDRSAEDSIYTRDSAVCTRSL